MTTGPANRADSACDISRDGLSKAPPSPAAATTTIQPDCEGASNLSTEKSATAFADDVVKCPTPLTLRQFLCTPEPSHNAKLAFDDYRTCDVILSLLPTRRLVFGHKKILADASDYFRSLFTTGIAGQLQQHVQIEMPASERAMLVCLAFMYDPSATCKPPATAFVRSTPPSLTAVLHGEVINLDEAVKSDFVSMFKTSGFLKLRKISTICLTTFRSRWDSITKEVDFAYPKVSAGMLMKLIICIPVQEAKPACPQCLKTAEARWTRIARFDATLAWGRTAKPSVIAGVIEKLAQLSTEFPLSPSELKMLHEKYGSLFEIAFSTKALMKVLTTAPKSEPARPASWRSFMGNLES